MVRGSRVYSTRPEVVASAIRELAARQIHETFPFYLYLRRLATATGRKSNLSLAGASQFFDTFLRVPGAPPNKPYLRPFTSRGRDRDALWLNKNIAGSFAPSSLREGQPLFSVVTVARVGAGAAFNLRPSHARLAREHLLLGELLPVVPLAVFLFRDFGLHSSSNVASQYVRIFRAEFGDEDGDFDELFIDDSDSRSGAEWLVEQA